MRYKRLLGDLSELFGSSKMVIFFLVDYALFEEVHHGVVYAGWPRRRIVFKESNEI